MTSPQIEELPPKAIETWDNTPGTKNHQIAFMCHTNGWWVSKVRLNGGKGDIDYLIVACQKPSSSLP